MINEKPKKVDVIVVLSGGEGRLEKGMELYKLAYARKIIVSNGLADNLWGKAITLLPRSSLILEDKADSTYESAIYVKKIMEKYQYHSAIIVSSDFHMRRVKYDFSRVFGNNKDELIYVSSNTSYNPKYWWMSKRNVGITISEYIKIIGNTFGVYGNEAKRKLYQYVEVFFY
ncbi:YdcF family protein [Neobacillus cucumis]|uniref:YdcF family protein n=1 Tax=Neobacillus cucumis TaxID=1740721 RepID=UPI002852FAFA|nr:YdcF family protein [Neobacillus cucumis]MDR4949066.1 YdcF family protein [Neobacillus cucumis]